jgi:hypothetical protein
MIKDIVVNLSVEGAGTASDFAVSVASMFGAHLSAVAFEYEPMIPPTDTGTIPADLIESQRLDNETNARNAVARFDAAAKRAGLSPESRTVRASVAGAGDVFGHIARNFDLSVVGQAESGKAVPDDMIIEGALF